MVRLALLFLTAALPVHAQRGIAVEAVEQLERELGGPVYAQSWALVVGVNRYPAAGAFRSLTFAADDARAVRALLVDDYGFPAENVVLLLDGQATRAAVTAAFTSLGARMGRDDRMLFYFSGHGHTVDLRMGGKRGFLVPADALLSQAALGNAATLEAKCLSMQRLKDLANAVAARHVLFLVDACYSGLAIAGRSTRELPYHLKTVAVRPMRGIVTAGRAGEEAFEDPDLGHGYFTKKLLDALQPVHGTILADTQPAEKPDGVITLKELSSYLVSGVARISQGRQNPQEAQEGEGQFLFVPHTPTRPRPPQPVVRPTPPVVRPEAARPGQTRINPKDGATMVFIPAGTFQMGSDPAEIDRLWAKYGWDADDKKYAADEYPKHRVSVDGFWMYKHEVTHEQYGKFLRATGHDEPRSWDDEHYNDPRQPVVGVLWEDAQAYCQWTGTRLPTEAEWEYAASGGRQFVFGTSTGDLSHEQANYSGTEGRDRWEKTAPVGSFPANPFGLFDMAGNVWEWCSDWYDRYPGNTDDDEDYGQQYRVVRGGAFGNTPGLCRVAGRNRITPAYRDFDLGFRCAKASVGF